MRYMAIACVASVMLVGTAYGNEGACCSSDSANPKMTARGFYVDGGGFLGDVSNLNKSLGQRGYSGLKDYAYVLGFGGMSAKWRVVSGLEFRAVAWRPTDDDNSVTELYGASGLYNIGFNVLKPHAKVRLYPYVGAGFGGYTLRLREEEVSFDTSLVRRTSDAMIWQNVGALQAGLGLDWLIPTRRNPNVSRVIGFRAGYVFDPSPGRDWEISKVEVNGGPSLSASGVYGQLVIGKSVKKPVKAWGKGKCAKEKECTKHEE
jgi:hypothetical protein